MKILPDINTLSVETAADILSIKINEAYEVKYRLLENSEEKIDIVHDLVESKAYATMFLYLNENFNLIVENEKDAKLFFEGWETLLYTNIRIVEEIGKPLTEISGYPIFESDRGILRGAGKKKILESFEEKGEIELENIDLEYLKNRKYDATIIGMSKCPSCGNIFDREANTFDEEVEDSIPYATLDNPYNERKVTYTDTKVKCPYCGDTDNEEDFPFAWVDDLYDAPNAEELVPGINSSDLEEAEEGTQCSDIAPKMDQDLGITKANPDEEKRHFDILLGDYNNSLDESVCFKGFLKNAEGQYQRGNYILVKENEKYIAIHKDKLKEYQVQGDKVILDRGEYTTGNELNEISAALKTQLENSGLGNAFSFKTGVVDGAIGLAVTRRDKHIDLVTVHQTIIDSLKRIGMKDTDFDSDIKNDSVVVAILNPQYAVDIKNK